MEVYIVGEDQVTKEILIRILDYIGGFEIYQELPARGGQIKAELDNYNRLSLSKPVILLTDLDQFNCAPELLYTWFKNISRNQDFYIRVAFNEAESWLMADRKGFSSFFKVPIDVIPESTIQSKRKSHIKELRFNYKSSLYLVREIIPRSSSKEIRDGMQSISGIGKGPLYNSIVQPFIEKHWNIDEAKANSYSLSNSINRLVSLIQ